MRSLLYILAAFILGACSYHGAYSGRGFDEAESLMHTDPTAALERLNAYDVSMFDDSASMARWALLYSEALVANNLSAPTDTIVNIAIDYYGARGSVDEFRRAKALKALITAGERRDELSTALYLQKEKEYLLYKERTARLRLAAFAVIVLLIAAGVIVWQRQRLRIRRLEYESIMAEASELETRLSGSLAGRFGIIDELCQTYYESQGTKAEKKAIVEKVKSQIESLKADDGLFADLERSVDDCRGGLLSALRREWLDMKPDDYRLEVYLAAGLSNRTIALLVGESVDVVYKRKSRLKARLSASELPDRELFLSVF